MQPVCPSEIDPEIIEYLIATARRKTVDDVYGEDEDGEDEDGFSEFNPCDHFGGNYDDAYYGGVADGETGMARMALNILGINWEQT